jgi:putative endonuclease
MDHRFKSTDQLGQSGEDLAARFLPEQGVRIVERRFYTRWGEVDLIGVEGDTWVFVEVKTRSQAYAIGAVDAVHGPKRRRVVSAALSYMKRHALEGEAMRFDVVLIEGRDLEWIPDAFEGPPWYTF